MRLLLLGITYRTAAVDLREKLSLSGDELEPTLRALRERFPHCEAVLLSTCNRVELYVARPTHDAPSIDELRAFLVERSGVTVEALAAASIHRENEHAVQHLFRVAAGLDSMVLGEPQVLGQVRQAYEQAAACDAVGGVLHRVFQQAIATAKKLRTTTAIGSGRVSVASVAVNFAQQIFESFGDKTVLAIGAGDMAKATLRSLMRLSPGRLWLVNRSVDRAAALAETLGLDAAAGGVRNWEDLDPLLIEADVVITSTGSREPIITVERFRPLIRKRRNRPIFIVDIAVPRDVEAAVGGLSNVYLYNIDDLQQVVSRSLDGRREEVAGCEAQVQEAAAQCLRQINNRHLGELIRELRHRLHDIGEAEQQRTLRKLGAAANVSDEALAELLSEHTHRVINKILHLPLSQLDHKDTDTPVAFYAAALRRLFQLDEYVEPPPPPAAPASPDDASGTRNAERRALH